MTKGAPENFTKLTLRNFQKHLFYITLLDDCFWLYPATLLKWGTANSV